jgi:hypothetical protein
LLVICVQLKNYITYIFNTIKKINKYQFKFYLREYVCLIKACYGSEMSTEAAAPGASTVPTAASDAPVAPSSDSVVSRVARSILATARDAEFMQIFMRVGGSDAEEVTSPTATNAPVPVEASDRRGKRTSISLPPPLKLPSDIGSKVPSNDTPTSRRAHTDAATSERRLSQPQTPAIAVKKNSPFAQMSRDIKLRRIQQQQQELQMLLRQGRKSGKGDNYFRRGEECYTDKDRAAAVNMGTRDIKLSLKLKRRQERSKALQIPEQAEPGTLLALGGHEMKGGDLRVALSFVNKVRLPWTFILTINN